MPEILHYSPNLTWRNLHEFPGEAKVKVLYEDPHSKAKVLLIRLEPGGQIDPRTHAANVHHYVLEGEYKTQGKVLEAGTYRLFPPFRDVPQISTNSGAVILMIYDPIGAS